MKKKLALLLAAVMVAAMVPVTAFAKSDNHVTNVVTVKTGDDTSDYAGIPSLVITEKDAWTSGDQFELALDGAEWKITGKSVGDTWSMAGAGEVVLLDKYTLSVKLTDAEATAGAATIELDAKVTGEEATVTIDPCDSKLTAGSYTFAKTTSANATVKTNGVVEVEIDGEEKELEAIVITETVKGALEDAKEVKVRLYNDFKFDFSNGNPVAVSTVPGLTLTFDDAKSTTTELYFDVANTAAKAGKVSITNVFVKEDGAKDGEVAEIVVSGAGVEKTTLEVAKAITYGVSFTVEDKKLPVFYSGRKYTADKTLTVTFKELAEDSWWFNRKTTLTFPEGVKVESVTWDMKDSTTMGSGIVGIKDNVVTIPGGMITTPANTKAKWEAEFTLSIAPEFAGEITCTLGGPAVKEDMTVVVAEAQYPVTFEVEVTDVSIDYRNVAVGDITVKETFAGALEESTELIFGLDVIDFEKGTKIEVVEGDIEFEDIDVTGGVITVTVKEESYKTPATFKLTGLNVYLDRSLPAGSYNLEVRGDGIFKNAATKADIKTAQDDYDADGTVAVANEAAWAAFNDDEYELAEAYIEVVTAGRDQDDSSFTTQVAVTIGADTMKVGQKVVALDAPAYIANGFTMLPVRAVADALSGDAATVLWNNDTKTVTIGFGARIISMTIGSKVMNINGVEITMNAAPEITGDRTFLPLRDLGYALGLTDADIAWDEATATATLN